MSPVEWIEKFFYIPELHGPIRLEDYQKRCLNEALTVLPDGTFKYSIIIWSDVKKSIKSTIAAAVALWRALQVSWGSVILVANDLDQADSRVGYYIRRAVELSPILQKDCRIRGYRIETPSRTFIESVPIDPTGEAGSNADMIVFSELWGAHQQAQQRMWTEMTLPPNKFGHSFRWIETYAGFVGESPLLEQLYEVGTKQGVKIWDDLEAYSNPNARMFCLWNTTPRMPWQTPEYYASEAAILLPNEFRRVHRNEWVSSQESFVPIEWWDVLVDAIPPLDGNTPMIVALDAAVSGACFGLVGVTRHPTRRDEVQVRVVKKWTPPKGGKIDYLGTPEHPGPELFVRQLCKDYDVVQVTYDMYQLHDMATRLSREGVVWISPFNQGSERLSSDKRLKDLIMSRRIWHDGNEDLREHINNANSEADANSQKLRIVKKSETRYIDLAVCLSMAAHRCLELNL